jgi:hypothetical protein
MGTGLLQVASTFTATPIKPSLEAAIADAGIAQDVRFFLYGQMNDFMLRPGHYGSDSVGAIVLVRLEDWLRENLKSAPIDQGSNSRIREHLLSRSGEFVSAVSALSQNVPQVWVMVCPSNGWIATRHQLQTLCRTLSNLLVARVRQVPIAVLSNPSFLLDGDCDDLSADRLGQMPFTGQTFDRLGDFLGSQIAQTSLWRGSCAAPTAPSSPVELSSYLAGLKVHVQIAPADRHDSAKLDRILRIAADFTLNGQKRDLPEEEIDQLVATGWCMRITVSDRLADYGISGILALRPTPDALTVESMSLSCTVLGKQVEYAVLSALKQIASDLKVEKIRFQFNPTERNQLTLRFLQTVADRVSDTEFVVPVALTEERLRAVAVNPGAWTIELERGVAGSASY